MMFSLQLFEVFSSKFQITLTLLGSLDFIALFKNFYLFIFKERGREGLREGEKHQYLVASCTSPTGDLAHDPGTCPD